MYIQVNERKLQYLVSRRKKARQLSYSSAYSSLEITYPAFPSIQANPIVSHPPMYPPVGSTTDHRHSRTLTKNNIEELFESNRDEPIPIRIQPKSRQHRVLGNEVGNQGCSYPLNTSVKVFTVTILWTNMSNPIWPFPNHRRLAKTRMERLREVIEEKPEIMGKFWGTGSGRGYGSCRTK